MVNDNFLLNFLGKILVPDWEDEFEYCLGLNQIAFVLDLMGFSLQPCKNTLGFREIVYCLWTALQIHLLCK